MLTSAGQIVAKRLHSKTRRNAKASPTRGGGIKRSADDGEVVWKDGLPIESGVFWLRHNLHPTAPAPLLVHDHLPVDAVLQGGDMGDNLLVHFKGDESLIGKLVSVHLTESRGFYYMGELV